MPRGAGAGHVHSRRHPHPRASRGQRRRRVWRWRRKRSLCGGGRGGGQDGMAFDGRDGADPPPAAIAQPEPPFAEGELFIAWRRWLVRPAAGPSRWLVLHCMTAVQPGCAAACSVIGVLRCWCRGSPAGSSFQPLRDSSDPPAPPRTGSSLTLTRLQPPPAQLCAMLSS